MAHLPRDDSSKTLVSHSELIRAVPRDVACVLSSSTDRLTNCIPQHVLVFPCQTASDFHIDSQVSNTQAITLCVLPSPRKQQATHTADSGRLHAHKRCQDCCAQYCLTFVTEEVSEQLLSKGWQHHLFGCHEPHQLVHCVEAQLAPLAGPPVNDLAALGRTRRRQLRGSTASGSCK